MSRTQFKSKFSIFWWYNTLKKKITYLQNKDSNHTYNFSIIHFPQHLHWLFIWFVINLKIKLLSLFVERRASRVNSTSNLYLYPLSIYNRLSSTQSIWVGISRSLSLVYFFFFSIYILYPIFIWIPFTFYLSHFDASSIS